VKSSGKCLQIDKGAPGAHEVWMNNLVGPSYGVILFNRDSVAANITAYWSDLGLNPSTPYKVRDLWLHQDMGTFTGSYSAMVNVHGVVVLKLT